MRKFYFTYGPDPAYPFQNGWTEIEAPDVHAAAALFRSVHPGNAYGLEALNCADIYEESYFKGTEMFMNQDNFGAACHERIRVTHEVLDAENQGEQITAAPPEGEYHAH